MAGTITIQGLIPGTLAGTQYVGPFTLTVNGTNFAITELILASGANTIPIPTWAFIAIIVPPVANAVSLTLKGASGDTGIIIDQAQPTLLNMPTGISNSANLVITAASQTAGETSIIFC